MKPCYFPYGGWFASLSADGNITSTGDVIAGYGTDNEVSLQTLNSNLAFQRARCATGSIEKSSSTSVAVTVPTLIFVFRKALSIIGIYFLDEWNGISVLNNSSLLEISYASSKITIKNNATAAVDYLLLSQNK